MTLRGEGSSGESHDAARTERFVELYSAAQRRVYACVMTLVHDPSDADEVLQETSLVLWRKFSEFRPDGDFVSWAVGIAYNQARKHLRDHARRVPQFSDHVLERIAAAQTENADWLEARQRALAECLEKLSESDRELIERSYQGDQTIKQVAEQLDRPLNTVYKSLQRIRLTLFECIDRKLRQEDSP